MSCDLVVVCAEDTGGQILLRLERNYPGPLLVMPERAGALFP